MTERPGDLDSRDYRATIAFLEGEVRKAKLRNRELLVVVAELRAEVERLSIDLKIRRG